MSKAKDAARLGLIIAVALVLSYVESLIPPLFAVPGVKLGLANLAVLIALYLYGTRTAIVVSLLRVLLAGFLFGSGMSILYAIAGAVMSFGVMAILKSTGRFGVTAVSVCGGISHNIGQILVAMAVVKTASIAWYLAILWFSGLASGAVIGLLGGIMIRRMEKVL